MGAWEHKEPMLHPLHPPHGPRARQAFSGSRTHPVSPPGGLSSQAHFQRGHRYSVYPTLLSLKQAPSGKSAESFIFHLLSVLNVNSVLSSQLPKVLNVLLQLRERGILPLSPLEEGPLRGPRKSFSTSMSLGGK